MADVTPEEKLLNVIKKAQGKMRLNRELKIFTKVNLALIVLIIIILAVFLADLSTPDYKAAEFDIPSAEDIVIPEVKIPDYDFEEDIAPEEKILVSEEDLLKGLNLLGIVAGNENQAVIEDQEQGKTYFLYEGDNLEDFTVYRIKADSVELEYKDKKFELRI